MLPKPSSSSTGFNFQMHPISSSHTALIPDPKTKFFPSPCQSPLSAVPFPLSAGQCLLICQGPAPITPILRCYIDLGPNKVQMKRFYFMEGILTEVWTVLKKKRGIVRQPNDSKCGKPLLSSDWMGQREESATQAFWEPEAGRKDCQPVLQLWTVAVTAGEHSAEEERTPQPLSSTLSSSAVASLWRNPTRHHRAKQHGMLFAGFHTRMQGGAEMSRERI